MDKDTAELRIVGSTMAPATQQAAQQNSVNLGGFAYSFEDLLQRVGARLEHAFSAADSSSGILQATNDPGPDAPRPEADQAAAAPERRERSDGNTSQRDAADNPRRDDGNTDTEVAAGSARTDSGA